MEVARCKVDPIYFISNYCWIVSSDPKIGRTLFKLRDYQIRLIKHYLDNTRSVVAIGRQSGKTETAAAFLLWWAIFKKDQRILIASNKGDNAKAIMKRLKFMYEECPWWLKPGVVMPGGWNVFSVEFENGSTIFADTTTENTGRGMPITLFYCDELAHVKPHIAAAFWTSIYPTISNGGACIVTSTPNTDEDQFAKIWLSAKESVYSDPWNDPMAARTMARIAEPAEEYETFFETEECRVRHTEYEKEATGGIEGFAAFHARWDKVPGRGPDFKRKVLASGTTEAEFARDYECAFLTKDATLVSATKLLALNHYTRPPRFVDQWGMRWYEEIKPNMAYAVTLDPSEGVDKDDACLQVFEVPHMKQVAEWNSNQADQPEQARMLLRTLRRIHAIQMEDPMHNKTCDIYYSVERNGLGTGILTTIEMQGEDRFPGFLIDSTGNKTRGLLTTNTTKKRCAIELASLIERNLITIRSRALVSQLKTFVKRGQGYAAKPGAKDDLVMAAILAVQLLEELRMYEPDLDDRVHVDLVDETYDPDDENHPDNIPMPIVMG